MKRFNKYFFLATVLPALILVSNAQAAGGGGNESPPPIVAAPTVDVASGIESSNLSSQKSGTQAITSGFKWARVQQTYRYLGSSVTWAYLESPVNDWIQCNDNECEQILIAAAASGHWLGVNFTGTSSTSFDHVRLWKD